VDGLSTTVGELSASVDLRFDAVDAAFVEQREYTEFSHTRLEAKMDTGFAMLEAKINAVDSRLEAKMDAGFARIERKLDQFIDVQIQTNERVDRQLRAR
jgi:hypothetical protein